MPNYLTMMSELVLYLLKLSESKLAREQTKAAIGGNIEASGKRLKLARLGEDSSNKAPLGWSNPSKYFPIRDKENDQQLGNLAANNRPKQVRRRYKSMLLSFRHFSPCTVAEIQIETGFVATKTNSRQVASNRGCEIARKDSAESSAREYLATDLAKNPKK